MKVLWAPGWELVISAGKYPVDITHPAHWGTGSMHPKGFGPTGTHKQSLVGLYVACECQLKALHRSEFIYLSSERSAPAIFSGLSSNKNIYLPKQEVECKLAL